MLVALVGFGVCHPGRGMVDVDERLPRGWLGRKCAGCCGCCGKRGSRKRGERLRNFVDDGGGGDGFDDHELLVVRKP